MSQDSIVEPVAVTPPSLLRHHNHQHKQKVDRLVLVKSRSLLGLTSGLAPVDSLIGGLKSDTMAFLTGSTIRLHAAERYCVRAQLPVAGGGLAGGAFFIDGGNSFDVYLFTELTRQHRLCYDATLKRQLLSRAFTIYELRSLIEDSILVLQTKGAKLLVVSEIFSLFNQDVAGDEAARVVRSIARSLSGVNKTERVPVLITSIDRPEPLTSLLEERCNVSAEIVEGNGWIRSRVFRHPSKAPFEVLQETIPGSFNQEKLPVMMVKGVAPRG